MIQIQSLKSYENLYHQLCIQNIKCQGFDCKKLHPRCFAGVCIVCLQEDKKKCNDNNCKLCHFNKKKFRKEFSVNPINGVYRFNLCKESKCQNQDLCQFLHIKWSDNSCRSCLQDDECNRTNDGLTHQGWQDLREIVYQIHNIAGIHPENICLCNNANCTNEHHLAQMNEKCKLYFKGLCPDLECNKVHISWEDYQQQGDIKVKIIEPCTLVNKTDPIQYEPTQIFLKQQEKLFLKHDAKESQKIDIIFIMDCTGSMGAWIEQSAAQIFTIIDKFKNDTKAAYAIRVGFVGYRDFKDHYPIVFNDLTIDINRIKYYSKLVQPQYAKNEQNILGSIIAHQQADGGGDEAEDVQGGIEQAYKLNISSHSDSMLITYLFADAPTHGSQYYDIADDDQADKIPIGSLESLMQKYKKLKEKNYFYCVRINESTDKMYEIMQENFEGLVITESTKPVNLPEFVQFTLRNSLLKSTLLKTAVKPAVTITATFNKPKNIPYTDNDAKNKVSYWQEFTGRISQRLRIGETELQIQIARMVFDKKEDEGMTSHMYYLKDSRNNRKMLAKIPKYVVEEYEKNDIITKETLEKYDKYIIHRFNSLVIAKQLAMVYRQRTKDILGSPPIFYVSPMKYILQKPFLGLTTLYAETYIDKQSLEWIKYSNNADYANPQFYYLTSFSHFTYEETQEMLVVTDLQGKCNILSDPSIQTSKEFNSGLQADDTNQQMKGIGDFLYKQHQQCNFICQSLGLQKEQKDSEIEMSSFVLLPSSSIFYICENCDEFRDISSDDYAKGKEMKCELCIEEEAIEDEVQCQCCKEKIKVPYAQCIRIGTIYDKCNKCKTRCQIQKEKDKCKYCGIDCINQVSNIQIDDQKMFLCKQAKKYLHTLSCAKCSTKYQFDLILDQKEYEGGQFICLKCKR